MDDRQFEEEILEEQVRRSQEQRKPGSVHTHDDPALIADEGLEEQLAVATGSPGRWLLRIQLRQCQT